MKKLLALVLALVMTLGLATVGTNAATWSDLKDTDKVAADREEAFKVLNSIQIFEGDENNNLNPDAQLTRAEAAKIIATLNLGKTAADNLSGNGGKFSDVPASNWASGYIEYCASTGIIAGRGDGTFDPAGALNFAAFSKMLLVSLGYVAEVEELVGNEWEFNVARIATTIDLYKGMDTPASKEIVKRADAAQMAFNVLKTPMVTYAYNGTNLLTNISAVGKTAAVYETTAARDTQTISTATVNDGSARGTYMVEFAERHFPKLTRNTHDTDDWGRPATTWTVNREEIGTFVNTDLLVLTTTEEVDGATVYKTLGGMTLLARYANDLSRTRALWNVYEDGVLLAGNTKTAVTDEIVVDGDTLDISGPGTIFEVYIDEDTYYNYGVTTNDTAKVPVVTIVAINTWLAEVLTDATSSSVLLGVYTARNTPTSMTASAKTVVSDINTGAAADITGYKEGDWVLVKMTRDDNTIREVSDPTIVKGAYINAYTASKNAGTGRMKTVTSDSVDYAVTNTANTDADILENYSLRNLQGFTYDLYTDGNAEHLFGIQYASIDTDLVFVTGYQKASTVLAATTVKANLIFTDGTFQTTDVAISQAPTTTAKAALAAAQNATMNAWFTYTKDDNGAITLVNVVDAANAATNVTGYAQWSEDIFDGDTTPDISNAEPRLNYVNNANTPMVAIGDGNSIYISAVADNTVTNGAISKVNGVNKGIKNTNIISVSPAVNGVPLTNFANPTYGAAGSYANVFFVFDANRYVKAAVVLTEKTAADHLAYITGTVKLREYVQGVGYVDTYKAILDGETEIKNLKVDSAKAGYDTTGKLAAGTLYAIGYDKNGEYVIVAEPAVTKVPATELVNNTTRSRGYATATVNLYGVDSIVYGDKTNKYTTNMFYALNAADATLGYIGAAASGNFWVTKDGGTSYTRYNTASQAWAAANAQDAKGNTYTVTGIYAMADKATGEAKTVVLTAATGAANAAVAGVGTLGTPTTMTVAANGVLNAVIPYTAPSYFAKQADLTIDVYVNGALYESGIAGNTSNLALDSNDEGTIRYTSGAMSYYGVSASEITFKIRAATPDFVDVVYKDADGNDVTSAVTAVTGASKAVMPVGKTNAAAFKFGWPTADTTGTIGVALTNALEATGDTATAATGAGAPVTGDTTNKLFTVTPNLYADGKGLATITLDTSALKFTVKYRNLAGTVAPFANTTATSLGALSTYTAGWPTTTTAEATQAGYVLNLAVSKVNYTADGNEITVTPTLGTAATLLTEVVVTDGTKDYKFVFAAGQTGAYMVTADGVYDTTKATFVVTAPTTGDVTLSVKSIAPVAGPTMVSVSYLDVNDDGKWSSNDLIRVKFDKSLKAGITPTVNATATAGTGGTFTIGTCTSAVSAQDDTVLEVKLVNVTATTIVSDSKLVLKIATTGILTNDDYKDQSDNAADVADITDNQLVITIDPTDAGGGNYELGIGTPTVEYAAS